MATTNNKGQENEMLLKSIQSLELDINSYIENKIAEFEKSNGGSKVICIDPDLVIDGMVKTTKPKYIAISVHVLKN